MQIALTVVAGVFGLLIGSFLNVVVHRVPEGRSVVSPPSSCPRCGAAIRPADNIPVVSWVALGGRCRGCREPISPRYPLVELGTGIAFACVAVWVLLFSSQRVPASTGLLLVALLYLMAISIALSLIDLDTQRLPNRIVLPAYGVGVVVLTSAGILGGDLAALGRAAVGMAALWVLYLVMALAYPGGMGFGDVKLAGVLGLFLGYLGWPQLVTGAFAAFLLGGLFGVVLVVSRRAGRKTRVPFGPWMLGGAWAGIVVGEPVARWYLALTGLA